MKLSLTIKILFIVLSVLVLLSSGILIVRMTDVLPNNTDIFFIEPKSPKTETTDDEKIWNNNTKVNIFKTVDINENGEIIVESSNDEKIIAPGMQGDYSFEIRNIGNMAVDTKTVLTIEFNSSDIECESLPIEVRFINYKGEDLFEGGWTSIKKYQECIYNMTLGLNSYADYKLFWRWSYELNDEFDTFVGNIASGNNIEIVVNIVSSASIANDINATGGISLGNAMFRTGGSIVPIPFIIINSGILGVATTLAVLFIKRKISKK